MRFFLFWTLMTLVCGYALWRGDRDHRIVALMCLTAAVFSHLLARPFLDRFSGVETGILAVDLLILCGFIGLALSSSRFWPMWIAGLQLTTSLTHAAKGLDLELIPRAYGAAAAFWSYPILLVLGAATWRAHRRRLAEHEGNVALA